MKGTVYNDKEDQAMELAKLSVEIVCGKDTKSERFKGRQILCLRILPCG